MGLDMYLYRKTYVKNWDHMSAEERHEITVKKAGKPRKDVDTGKICYVVEEIAYWRKANAIHKWFVDNVQGGEDNCGTYYVSQENLQELVDLCEKVLNTVETVEGDVTEGIVYTKEGKRKETRKGQVVAQPEIAEKLLPNQAGFFFGSTEYDEYYLDDLRRTVETLKPYLSESEDGEFEYHSSW